ncbi:MAG: OmpA family protein [Nitrospiraceae bacterium]|nr:OmpA family protein [Nitrospiraceae bacterium]
MKRSLLLLAILGLIAAGCSHAVKQNPEQAVQAAPAPKAVQKAPAKENLNPSANTNIAESVAPTGGKASSAAVKQAEAIGDIHFAFDKYDLNKNAKSTLDKLSALLQKNPAMTVKIEGRCDERGTEEYNLALGDKRATQAEKYLVALGVPAGSISTVSYGKDKPLCLAHTEKCWAVNRSDHFDYK